MILYLRTIVLNLDVSSSFGILKITIFKHVKDRKITTTNAEKDRRSANKIHIQAHML